MTTWILLFALFMPATDTLEEGVADAATQATVDSTPMRYHGIERLLAKFAEAD